MEPAFKALSLALVAALIALRARLRRRAGLDRFPSELRNEPLDSILVVSCLTLFAISYLAYLLKPERTPGMLALHLRWTGVGLGILALLLWGWAGRTLGRNFSFSLQPRPGHRLVTEGPYRRIRHPLYAATLLFDIALSLVTADWRVGLCLIGGASLAFLHRIPREETMMTRAFGDAYREYRDRTGCLLPRLPRARAIRQHLLPGLVGTVLFICGLGVYDRIQHAVTPAFVQSSPLDAGIPFIPEAAFAYLLFYPLVILTAFILERETLLRLFWAGLGACVMAWSLFLLLPLEFPHPQIAHIQHGLLRRMFAFIHTVDTPYNTFPSLHVAVTWICASGFRRERPSTLWTVRLVAVATILSTMLVKQHSVLDVAGGLVLGWLALRITHAFRPSPEGDLQTVQP